MSAEIFGGRELPSFQHHQPSLFKNNDNIN